MPFSRVIPTITISLNNVYKTTKFTSKNYIGDPLNTIKIFNDKNVDEACIIDFTITKLKGNINFELLERIAKEANFPLSYGGGIKTIEDVEKIIGIGYEKIIINSSLSDDKFINNVVNKIGSSSLIASIDIKKNFLGKYKIYDYKRNKLLKIDIITFIGNVISLGVGEILLNNVTLDGTMKCFDKEIISQIVSHFNIPIIPIGGACSYQDLNEILKIEKINAVSAASLFIYYDNNKSVLINYPSEKIINRIKK